jgi:hypothetical protein
VRCGRADPKACVSIPEKFPLALTHTVVTSNQFRIYVPPGTHKIETMFYTSRDDAIALAVRYGSPLEGYATLKSGEKKAYSKLIVDDISDIKWHGPSVYGNLDDYRDKDILRGNSGGAITILSGGIGEVVEKGGWFYFKIVDFRTGARLRSINSYTYVYTDEYLDWYNNTQWDNGDPY